MARRPRVHVRSARRSNVWFQFAPAQATISAASTATALFSLNAAALALRPFTIVRTRGHIYYRSDQVAASEEYGGGLGMAVVSDQASAVGITAVPTPVTDYGSELFFYISQMHGRFAFGTAASFAETGRTEVIDSKAMRKVNENEDVFVSFETPSFSSSFSIVTAFRMLVKLH